MHQIQNKLDNNHKTEFLTIWNTWFENAQTNQT